MITTIYVENGVGRAVMDAINLFTPKHGITALFQADIHKAMQRPQNGDEWWIRDVTGRHMAILTQDRAILDDGSERDTVRNEGAHLIALGDGNYTTWNKLRAIINHWDYVEHVLQAPGPAAATLWLSKAELEKF